EACKANGDLCVPTSMPSRWTQVEGVIGEAKSISRIMIIWLVLGFILFVIRTWIFALFRILPTGRFGSFLLRGPLRQRNRFEQNLERVEWEHTIATWHERGFATDSAIYRPHWYEIPSVPTVLRR